MSPNGFHSSLYFLVAHYLRDSWVLYSCVHRSILVNMQDCIRAYELFFYIRQLNSFEFNEVN